MHARLCVQHVCVFVSVQAVLCVWLCLTRCMLYFWFVACARAFVCVCVRAHLFMCANVCFCPCDNGVGRGEIEREKVERESFQ